MPSWAFRTLFIIFAAILAGTAAKAQSVGIHNSGKGFGLAFQEYDKDGAAYSSFILYADIYGLPLGKTAYPGIKGNYSRNHFFGNVSIDRDVSGHQRQLQQEPFLRRRHHRQGEAEFLRRPGIHRRLRP